MTLDLTPDSFDLVIESNDKRGIEVSFVDLEDVPIDLTGYAVTVEGPEWMNPTVSDPTSGTVQVALTPTDYDDREFRFVASGPTTRVLCTGRAKST